MTIDNYFSDKNCPNWFGEQKQEQPIKTKQKSLIETGQSGGQDPLLHFEREI